MKINNKFFASAFAAAYMAGAVFAMADRPADMQFDFLSTENRALSSVQENCNNELKTHVEAESPPHVESHEADAHNKTEDTAETSKQSWGSWFKSKASNAASAVFSKSKTVTTKIAETAYITGVTHATQEITGSYFESRKIDIMNAAYAATQSSFEKFMINANWANACETAYKRGSFIGSIGGHFLGAASWDLAKHAWNGDVFSKATLHDMFTRASQTGLKQLLLNGTEAFVVNSAEFCLRTYVVNPLIWSGSTTMFGPLAPVVALPVLGFVNNSQAVETAIHMAYNTTVPLTFNAGAYVVGAGYNAASSLVGKFAKWWNSETVSSEITTTLTEMSVA